MAGTDYGSPPVVEAAIGIEFSTLPMGFIALADTQHLWRDDFPNSAEQPALPPTRPISQGAGFEMVLGSGMPAPRLWLLNDDGHLLIQVQNDRLFLNWRRLDGAADAYLGFDAMLARFREILAQFVAYVVERLGTPLVPLVSEWTYVNHIDSTPTAVSAFRIWNDSGLNLPGTPMVTRFQTVRGLQFGTIPGQLTLNSEPLGVGDTAPMQFTISSQFFHNPDTTIETALEAVEQAHRDARLTFEAVTTDEARKGWREA